MYEPIEFTRKFQGRRFVGMVAAGERNKFYFMILCYFDRNGGEFTANMPYCSDPFDSIKAAEFELHRKIKISVKLMNE